MAWFRTRKVSDGVYLIAEPALVNLWLIEGAKRAVLLDTGCGISPIRTVVNQIHRPSYNRNQHTLPFGSYRWES